MKKTAFLFTSFLIISIELKSFNISAILCENGLNPNPTASNAGNLNPLLLSKNRNSHPGINLKFLYFLGSSAIIAIISCAASILLWSVVADVYAGRPSL